MSSTSWKRRVKSDSRKIRGGGGVTWATVASSLLVWRQATTLHEPRRTSDRVLALRGRGAHLTELSAVLKARGAAPRTATGVSPFHPPSYYFVPPAAFTYLIDSDTLPAPDWEVAEPLTPRQSHEDELGFHPTSWLLQRQKINKYIFKIIIFFIFLQKNISVAFSPKDSVMLLPLKRKRKKEGPLFVQLLCEGYIHRWQWDNQDGNKTQHKLFMFLTSVDKPMGDFIVFDSQLTLT